MQTESSSETWTTFDGDIAYCPYKQYFHYN
jgi:hypothetical protein